MGGLRRLPDGKIDYKEDFFGRPSYLTVSGQLQVCALCVLCVLGLRMICMGVAVCVWRCCFCVVDWWLLVANLPLWTWRYLAHSSSSVCPNHQATQAGKKKMTDDGLQNKTA